LLAVRRSLPLASPVLLEIPSAPMVSTATLPKAARRLRARSIWVAHADGYQLVGLKFSHSLMGKNEARLSSQRKALSSL